MAAGLAGRALGEANVLGPETLGALADVERDVLSLAKRVERLRRAGRRMKKYSLLLFATMNPKLFSGTSRLIVPVITAIWVA